MNGDQQVVLLLKFALTIGPIAVYLLTLGLLNAQPRPHLLSGRTDFSLLAIVFFPIVLWLMLVVVQFGWLVLATVAFAVALGFYWMMPRRQSSWVIYNVSERQFARALSRVLSRLGHEHQIEPAPGQGNGHPSLYVPALKLRIRLSPFPLLQNVTCRFERGDGEPIEAERVRPVVGMLRDELGRIHALPSASAACFLLIGTVMLSAPLVMMSQHMDAIVRVVRNLLA